MSAPADHHPEIGVMLYDNPKECKAGWASIAGAEAMYMRSHADLANHVIWVTNSEFSAFRCWDTAMCIICAGLLFSARRCIKWPPISAFQWPAILQNLPRSNWPKLRCVF